MKLCDVVVVVVAVVVFCRRQRVVRAEAGAGDRCDALTSCLC